ncbi:Uncharacterised protein [Mycobacteroides abscessus]|nr:Uncharacterised protein [Mycobacteroides abscessus]
MEDNRAGRALRLEHIEDVSVRITVVNHQRLARPLSQLDMPSKCLALNRRLRAPLQTTRPIQVQTGLPDRHHPGMSRQRLQFGTGLVGEVSRASGMQRHRGIDTWIGVRRRDRPPGRVQVVGDRDDSSHTDGLRMVDHGAHICCRDGAARVQMGVGVDERRERLRVGWAGTNAVGWAGTNAIGRGLPVIAGRHQVSILFG